MFLKSIYKVILVFTFVFISMVLVCIIFVCTECEYVYFVSILFYDTTSFGKCGWVRFVVFVF